MYTQNAHVHTPNMADTNGNANIYGQNHGTCTSHLHFNSMRTERGISREQY